MKLNHNLDMSHESKWLTLRRNRDAEHLLVHVQETGHFYAGSNFFIDRTGKDAFFVLYTVSGCGVLRHKGQKHLLSRHDAVLIHGEERTYYGTVSEDTWEHYWVQFTGSGAQNYYDIVNTDGIAKVHIEDPAAFAENFEDILRRAGDQSEQDTILTSMRMTNLLTLLTMARHAEHEERVVTEHSEAMNRAIEYIQDNYTNSVALKDLVNVANMSTSYFTKLFRQHTGMTPHEYLINYRIGQAKKALRHTKDPVGQVAVRVGFQDVCSFTRAFRRITGTTPRDFRRTGE